MIGLGIFAGLTAEAKESFSVKAWSESLKTSLAKNGKDVPKLLDRQKSRERRAIESARKMFEKGDFKKALTRYDQVEKGSDLWLEAVEEKGWSHYRQNDVQKALAQTKTLLSPTFLPIVGAEPFFLQSLSLLKICDYKGILETHKLFKETQKPRLTDIQKLADGGTNQALQDLALKADRFPLEITEVGKEATQLPRLFYRDVVVQKSLLRMKMAEEGIPVLTDAAGGKYRTLAQKTILRLRKNAENAKANLKARISKLAAIENEENFKILQKLNLIEVETIQRVHIDQKLDQNTYSQGKFAKTDNEHLVFPDDGSPWIDELDKYQVQVKACPQNLRRKM
jgi:hypothetical protein